MNENTINALLISSVGRKIYGKYKNVPKENRAIWLHGICDLAEIMYLDIPGLNELLEETIFKN